jgi:hypothetical protein
MPIHNNDIVKNFNKVADLLEIKGANPFRVRAYRNAARTISGLSKSVADLIAENKPLQDCRWTCGLYPRWAMVRPCTILLVPRPIILPYASWLRKRG